MEIVSMKQRFLEVGRAVPSLESIYAGLGFKPCTYCDGSGSVIKTPTISAYCEHGDLEQEACLICDRHGVVNINTGGCLMETQFKVGDKVSKNGGDYKFDGVVVAAFTKLSGVVRYVVEDDRGVLFIYNEKNLKLNLEQIGTYSPKQGEARLDGHNA